MVQLAPFQNSVIVGLILSDGWLRIGKRNINALLGFNQSFAKSQYFLCVARSFFVFTLLSHYCSRSPLLLTGSRLGKRTIGLQLETRSMPCLTSLHSLFYSNGKKIIPHNIYCACINACCFISFYNGRWICTSLACAGMHGLILCTDSYSVKDVVRLINVLIVKYRLKFTLHYHGPTHPRIYISSISKKYFKV